MAIAPPSTRKAIIVRVGVGIVPIFKIAYLKEKDPKLAYKSPIAANRLTSPILVIRKTLAPA